MEESEEAELNAPQQRAVLIMGKLVTLAIGTLVVGFSYCVPYVSDSVVDSANLLSSAFYGPILATFTMGYIVVVVVVVWCTCVYVCQSNAPRSQPLE